MMIPSAYISLPRVEIAGQFDADLSGRVVRAMVVETWEGLYRCEITVANIGPRQGRTDYLYLGRDTLDFGDDLLLRLGSGDPPAQLFKGRISALEATYPHGGGAELTILAEDGLQALRMTRRTRSFEDVSDEDIFRQIASEHSLTPDVSVSGETHTAVVQVNLSDLAFIRERARALNAEIWLDDTTLFVQPRTERDAGRVELAYGANLLHFRVRADLAHQCSEFAVTGWDVAAKDAINESASDNAISAELGGDTGGGAILSQTFGTRRETAVHTVPLTTAEARAAAEARYRERARRFVTGSGMADGDARIRTGTIVTLAGLGGMFDGEYRVVRVVHSFDLTAGFRTSFDVERPGIGTG